VGLFGKKGWLKRGRGLGGGLMRSWLELLRGLGQGFLDVLRAEWEQLLADFGVSAKRLAFGVGLLGAAAMLCFWLLGTFVYFLIQVVAIWLPVWGAAGIVVLVLLLVIGVLGLVGMRFLKKIENPIDTVGRRWDDHLDWWEARLVDERFDDGTARAEDDDEEDGE